MNNIFLFHGSDTVTSREKVQLWKKQFLKKHSETGLEIFDAEKISLQDFKMNLLTLPFLCEKKLIILKDLFISKDAEELKEFAEVLKLVPDFAVLVLFESKAADKRTSLYKWLKKEAKIEEFNLPEKEEIQDWIFKRARTLGLQIDFRTAGFLGNYCGNNTEILKREIEKLAAYCEGRNCTEQDIRKLCAANIEQSVFTLVEEISKNNKKKAILLFNQLLNSGEEPIKIFFLIVYQFRLLLQLKLLSDKGYTENEIASSLKKHPFVVKKNLNNAKNFSLAHFKEIYQKMLEIDYQSKTGGIKRVGSDSHEYKLAVEKFILEI